MTRHTGDGDSATGFDRAPDRYSAMGRETIDRWRDDAYEKAEAFLGHSGPDADALADLMFGYLCDETALKYEDRAGLKGPVEIDFDKARFYRQMSQHVRTGWVTADPRSGRDVFVPYSRVRRAKVIDT